MSAPNSSAVQTPKLGPIPKALAGVLAVLMVWLGGRTGIAILMAFLGIPLFSIMGGGAAVAWLSIDDPTRQHVRFIAGDVLQDKFAGSPILVTIPLFTFVGYLMAESKTPERIVRASRAFFGWMPGGLAVVCICASAFFTTLTGASGVTIVAIGGLLYPALRQQKYPDDFSLGLVTTGGSLGLLLPPSLPILVYSLVAAVPINETFKAGLVPGFLVMVVLGVYSAYVGVKAKLVRTSPDLREMGAALWEIKWEMFVPVIILGGLATGFTGLDESAAITALYVLVVEVWVYGDLSLKKDLPRIARNSMSLAGAVILILAMANSLMNYVDFVRVPEHLLHWLETHTSLDTSWKFLIGLNIFLLVIGMLMDGFSAILVSVPLIIPIATTFRMNPFHLGMIFLLNLEIAYVCPPLGLNLYISSFRFERPVVSLYKVVLPFVGLLVLTLGIVTYFPKVSTILLEGQIEQERQKDLKSIEACERPTYEYDRLQCVQSDPLNRKPCDARSEYVHCLAAPTNDADDAEFQNYCVKAFQKTCVQNFWKDPRQGEVCPGKPWAERWVENKARCNAKNGIVPTPPGGAGSAAPAPSGSAPSGGIDEDELMKAMLGGGAASAAPSGSASAAPSGSASGAPPAASGSAAPGGEDDLLKDMLK
ncbi:MAG: TRAP transporter large permease [Polyangiales bacterium]